MAVKQIQSLKWNKKYTVFFLLLIPIPVLIISLFIGPSQSVTSTQIGDYLVGRNREAVVEAILLNIRVPRILLTFLVGAALSVSGNSIQAVFRNPLTDSYILGLSSGAAFGAALSLAFGVLSVQFSAFLFGALAVFVTYFLASNKGHTSTISLILSGIIVSGVFTALLTIIQYVSDPFKLQSIVHWTMGNLHNANWEKLRSAYIPILIGLTILVIFSWRLNILSLGDEQAKVLGMHAGYYKLGILFAITLCTGAAVAVAGVIGLYGLMIPHIVRLMVGADNRITIPVNLSFGGAFLVLIDDFSRAWTSYELPIGVFTFIIGAPFFMYLLKKNSIGWS